MKAFDVNLADLSPVIRAVSPQSYADYQQKVFVHLCVKELHFSEAELLKEYNKTTIEELIAENPDRFIQSKDETGNKTNHWYDTWMDHTPVKNDSMFNMLFAYRLRLLDIQDIEEYLNYHLEKSFAGDTAAFTKYLKLTIRKFEKIILNLSYSQTILDWIDVNKQAEEQKTGRKGKIKREIDDKLTSMNQELTVMLIHFLQKGRIILKDEYLNNKEAGEAFSILTGYSGDTLRQKLGQVELDRLRSKKNLTELFNHLTKVTVLVQNELRDKK